MKTISTTALAFAAVFSAAVSAVTCPASAFEDSPPACPAEEEQIGGGVRVERECDPATGVVTMETSWREGFGLYREDGPSIIERDPATGTVTLEAWASGFGILHREGGPALIERDAATGTVTVEEWRRGDERHREGGPARIERDPATGVVRYEEWSREGHRHREDGPVRIGRSATGATYLQEWWLDGERQEPPRRESAPAPAAPRP